MASNGIIINCTIKPNQAIDAQGEYRYVPMAAAPNRWAHLIVFRVFMVVAFVDVVPKVAKGSALFIHLGEERVG